VRTHRKGAERHFQLYRKPASRQANQSLGLFFGFFIVGCEDRDAARYAAVVASELGVVAAHLRAASDPKRALPQWTSRQSLIEIASVFLHLGYSAVLKPKSFE
jgi:hypothetical protein